MKIGLLVLIGIPASGKTTLAKTLVNSYQRNNTEVNFYFIKVSYDDFMPNSTETSEFSWKLARYTLSQKIRRLILSIKTEEVKMWPDEFKSQLPSWKPICGNWNYVIIIDDNMYFKSMRYSLFQIAKKENISYCQVYIKCPLQTALHNNAFRFTHIIPPHIIEKMHRKIEPPNYKNKWEKYSVELAPYFDVGNINSQVIPVLNTSLEHSFSENDGKEKELSKLQCRKSVLHQVDIGLRQVIGCRIKKYIMENSKQEHKEYIDSLKLKKSDIYSDIKFGNICLPDRVLQEIEDDVSEKLNLIAFLDGYI